MVFDYGSYVIFLFGRDNIPGVMFFAVVRLVFCGWFLASAEGATGDPELTIIHFNDFHARYEPVNAKTSGVCHEGDTCVGEFSIVTKIKF